MTNEPKILDFSITKGCSRTWRFNFKRNGGSVDLTDWYVFFTAKSKLSDTDENAAITIDVETHYAPLEGVTYVTLTMTNTDITPGSYFYDIKWVDDGSPAKAGILMTGKVTINRGVTTRSTPLESE